MPGELLSQGRLVDLGKWLRHLRLMLLKGKLGWSDRWTLWGQGRMLVNMIVQAL